MNQNQKNPPYAAFSISERAQAFVKAAEENLIPVLRA